MEFYIEDNLHYKLQDYCNYNDLDLTDYINDCIVKQFNIDRYGDLNEIIENKNKKEEPKIEFSIIETIFDDKNQNYVIKHNLGDDIIIPLATFFDLKTKLCNCKKEEIYTSSVEEEIEKDINKKKKRTLKTR